jgi:glycerophosphoryl diester phosphodiesterase
MIGANTFLIAHRGESADAPENTLASINLAWKRNVKAVEIDIRLTADHKIVVIHDNNTFRVSRKWMKVSKTDLKKLKALDVGITKGKQWKNEPIPTLKDVLKTIPDDGKLIIEIKNKSFILSYLKDEIEISGIKNSQIEIISFHRKLLEESKKMMPQFKTLWLLELDYLWPQWLIHFEPKQIIHKTKQSNLDGVNLWAGKLATKQTITSLKKAGLLVYLWTINDVRKARQLIEYGADAITSDNAVFLLNELKK